MTQELTVSVVMPIYNEQRYIKDCVDSLLKQDFPKEEMEWIFVDGRSTDKTLALLKQAQGEHPGLIRVLDNPRKTVPYAMNIGINASKGRYIVRMDAHAQYAPDYISQCVKCLEETGADNVGGVMETKSRSFTGNAIARMLSSKFGVGGSQFRVGGESGYVDTVPFGAFRREVFSRWGGYDERLTRNQDNEMNYRIRKNGGKIYLSEKIHLSYYCRDTIGGIVRMAVQNGKWNIITMKLCPGSMGLRHFVPFAFLCSLIVLPLLSLLTSFFWWVLLAELVLYLLLDVLFSVQAAGQAKYIPLLLFLFPCFHLTYGFGSLLGLFAAVKYKREK